MRNAEFGTRNGGATLVELIVVVLILGLVFGVSGLAFLSLRAPRESEVTRELRRARSEAIRTGRPTTTGVHHTPRTTHVLFLPDGRAIGDGVDPLTGAPLNAAR
jgi:Tfp pilus assembly protein FimT